MVRWNDFSSLVSTEVASARAVKPSQLAVETLLPRVYACAGFRSETTNSLPLPMTKCRRSSSTSWMTRQGGGFPPEPVEAEVLSDGRNGVGAGVGWFQTGRCRAAWIAGPRWTAP